MIEKIQVTEEFKDVMAKIEQLFQSAAGCKSLPGFTIVFNPML